MTPEEQQKKKELEQQISVEFSQLQQNLWDLKKNVEIETDETKKQENSKKIKEMEAELSEIKVWKERLERLTSLQEQDLQSLKTRLESLKNTIKSFRWEIVDLQNQVRESLDKQNEKSVTPTTYELLKDSETYNRLLNIISSNPSKFKKLKKDEEGNELDTPEKKLEYIFKKIRKSLTLFLKNKLWDSEGTEKVINNTIAPAFEWSLMELLRKQWNEANVGMLEWMNKISWNSLLNLFDWVKWFADKFWDWYSKFNQWMNAVDYLSVHNWVLRYPDKSEVLTNPLKFQEYMNDARFSANNFSPYANISDNIFKIDENNTFEFGISRKNKSNQPQWQKSDEEIILERIWNIQVVNNPKTTSLIVWLLDKPEKFFNATSWLQNTANHLLDSVNSVNSITKIFGIDIFWEIKSWEKSLAFRILDFICKLIWITWWLDWVVKKRRLDRMKLTDEKNDNIGKIFKEYQELVWKWSDISITDANSCSTALADFALTDLDKTSTTKWDHLRDVISDNIDINLVSSAIVQQTLWNDYLKKEIVTVDWKQQEKIVVDTSKITDSQRKELAHKHIINMKNHLESNFNDLKEFYENIHNSDDLVLCMTASLYVNKEDVIEWVKAKVFLPENYGVVRSDGTVNEGVQWSETEQQSWEVSKYKLSEWEYPFKDVPPYQGVPTYDLRKVKMTPILNYSELTKKHEWSVTLNWSNIINKRNEYPSNGTAWNKSNNPCDISHSNSDLWYLSYVIVADWQKLAKYDTPVNGIASAMRLLKRKYSNKSITEINVGWYQSYYKPNEEIWLSALRIKWITDQCNALWVWPHQMLDFNDPTTLKSFVAQVAVLETGTHIGQKLLDEAYNKAFAS